MGQLVVNGFIQTGDDGCGCAGSGGSPIERLGLACGNGSFQSIIQTESPIQVRTPGAPGDTFVDLAVLGDFKAIEFVYFRSDSPFVLRIGAAAAKLVGNPVPGSIIANGTDAFSMFFGNDADPIWTPTAGTYTTAQALAAFNAACAAEGLPTPRIAYENGQYVITDSYVGPFDSLQGIGAIGINAGGLASQFGFPGPNNLTALGAGSDVEFQGLFMAEFRRNPYAPARIQVSGSGSLTVIAAGRTSL